MHKRNEWASVASNILLFTITFAEEICSFVSHVNWWITYVWTAILLAAFSTCKTKVSNAPTYMFFIDKVRNYIKRQQPDEVAFPVTLISSTLDVLDDFGFCSSVQTIKARQSMQPCCAFETEWWNNSIIRNPKMSVQIKILGKWTCLHLHQLKAIKGQSLSLL